MTAPALPRLGGLNPVAVRLEIRRVLRNRRTVLFTVAMPALFLLSFGLPNGGRQAGRIAVLPLTVINMGVYAAMLAATSCGAGVALERGVGWTRQLRLTPLLPIAYVAVKVVTAMAIALLAVVVQYLLGAASGVRMPLRVWLLSGLIGWLGSAAFAALGLFVGYLLPSENVMQFVGPALALLALLGGLFVPLPLLPDGVRTVAALTPLYGVGQLARAPLTGEVSLGAVANAVLWTAAFTVGAAWLHRRDTVRA
ncbi:ABC transporter permease [Kitasatospora sp. NPDC086791]|uniref:ABC transporter permease n=1 Tax=Kitasatospora sp. NPDC086791 TaxID=3155178 RepID=UPI0034202E51